jgi:hypothetical protein
MPDLGEIQEEAQKLVRDDDDYDETEDNYGCTIEEYLKYDEEAQDNEEAESTVI